jgi:hypothetical protein
MTSLKHHYAILGVLSLGCCYSVYYLSRLLFTRKPVRALWRHYGSMLFGAESRCQGFFQATDKK